MTVVIPRSMLVMHEGRLVAEMAAAEASEERIMRRIHLSKEEGAEREPVQRAH